MGMQLDSSIARKLGEILKQDVGFVRIHTGLEADALNRRFDSTAFARGSEVFFRRDSYRPDSDSGMELLGHEVIHVCQQLSGRVSHVRTASAANPEEDEFEREARYLARPVAALMRGNRQAITEEECSALRDFRSRPPIRRPQCASTTIQRSAASLIAAASVPPPGAAAHGPVTCHHAAIGWLLMAENYTSPWKLMYYAMGTFAVPLGAALGMNPGSWLKQYIYAINVRIHRVDVSGANPIMTPSPGDILFTCQGGPTAMHSMIVVPGPVMPGPVYIHGFNNAATFNYLAPHPVAHPVAMAPAGAYDPVPRDVHDANLWDPAGTGFGAIGAGAELRWVRYQNAAQAIRTALAHWRHSNFRGPGGGHGWQHVAPPGAICPPSCPH